MECITVKAKNLFREAIIAAYPHLADKNPPVIIGPVPDRQASAVEADYQCNSAMPLMKMLSRFPIPTEEGTKGPNPNPVSIAENIVACLPIEQDENIFENFTIVKGFINFSLKKSYVGIKILDLIESGVTIDYNAPSKVIVDYSSPNIAKEMHVGHLRSTILGDCISHLLEFVGCEVLRLNHIGDWGTQFGMLLTLLFDSFGDDYAKFTQEIESLQSFYKQAKAKFDQDEEFKKRSYETVVKLQSKDPQAIEAWQQICDISRKEFNILYERLDIKNLIERGESFYHDMMSDMIKDLKDKGLLIKEEGRELFWPNEEQKGCVPLTVVKSDGGYTYDTSDLAAVRHRTQVEQAKRIIYVTDSGQASHFQSIFACTKRAGYADDSVRLEHVGFGVVLGEDKKKFKTRSGDTVRLSELLDEGMERSLAKLKEKGRDKELSEQELKQAQEAVAYGCIKYSDLSRDRNKDYIFSFDQMLKDQGNTAVYLLYTVTRIRSIARKANLGTIEDIMKSRNTSEPFELEHPRQLRLAKFILRFPDVIAQCVEDLFFHSLCQYLYDLSSLYSDFYEQCYCIETSGDKIIKINVDRILLCEATAFVMEKGLNLLGIKTVSRM